MQWTIRGTLVGSLIAATSALHAQQQPAQQPQQTQQPQQLQQLPQIEDEGETVKDAIATVNGDAITRTELDAKLETQLQGRQVDPMSVDRLRKQMLNSLCESRLVEQFVTENREVEEEQVEAVINGVKEQLAAQQTSFDRFLASKGYSEDSFKKRIEGSIGWQEYQQQQMTPESLQEYFQQNQEQFQADNFQAAQQEVIQAYSASLWDDIVEKTKPEAEIEILDPALSREPQQQQPAPISPGNVPPM